MSHIHGGDLTTFRQQFPDTPVLDFSANINPLGLPQGVKDALVGGMEAYTHYPDPQNRALRQALSAYEGVKEEWILPGNGASDIICRIAWSLRPKKALLLAPTFAEYERSLVAAGCGLVYHDLREEDGFVLTDVLLEQIDGVDLVFLCNPNNPTGALIPFPLLANILAKCRETGAILAVDECFLDFTEDCEAATMKRLLASADNLLILRAFTKIFAMPGLRLGYLLCSNRTLLNQLESAGPLWNVSVPAQLCGIAAVGETAYLAELRRQLPVWRAQLASGLEELGCRVYPGAANYLLFRAREGLAADLRPRGILLRECANFRGLSPEFYRAAVRAREENSILLREMKTLHQQRKEAFV